MYCLYDHVDEVNECKGNLRNLYELVRGSDGTFLVNADILSLAKRPGDTQCKCAKRPYIYRCPEVEECQVSDPGRTIYFIIAWCPSPCHDGSRVVLLDNGAVHVLSEKKFQSAIDGGFRFDTRTVSGHRDGLETNRDELP